jgi:hypothetical protein
MGTPGTVILSTLAIASSSIGIQFYNKCDNCKKMKTGKASKGFLIGIILMGIAALLWEFYKAAKYLA